MPFIGVSMLDIATCFLVVGLSACGFFKTPTEIKHNIRLSIMSQEVDEMKAS